MDLHPLDLHSMLLGRAHEHAMLMGLSHEFSMPIGWFLQTALEGRISLGKRLYLRVNDLSSVNEKPEVTLNASLKEVIIEISEKMLGVTAVTENSKILGIITDGDLRRMLSKSDDIAHLMAKDIMGSNPKSINEDAMAVDAKEVMEEHGISQLLVEKDGKYAGVVHLHDLIKEGII